MYNLHLSAEQLEFRDTIRDFVAQEIKKMLADHTAFDFTKRIVRPDDAVRHVRYVGAPALNGPGFVGTGIDVTEQEELTRALRKSEEALRLVVNSIGALVTTYTADGELEFGVALTLAHAIAVRGNRDGAEYQHVDAG